MVDNLNLRLYLVVKNLIHNIDIRILESTLYCTGYHAYCMALSVVWLGQAKWRGRPLQTVAADDCTCKSQGQNGASRTDKKHPHLHWILHKREAV